MKDYIAAQTGNEIIEKKTKNIYLKDFLGQPM
jgi:hypothetical protein